MDVHVCVHKEVRDGDGWVNAYPPSYVHVGAPRDEALTRSLLHMRAHTLSPSPSHSNTHRHRPATVVQRSLKAPLACW